MARLPAGAGSALIVDGDNVPPAILAPLLSRMEEAGPVSHRKVFRNWRSTRDAKVWDDASKRLAFERVDRYKTTEGKNASDIAVAVEAMDLFHAGVRRFCIASGDTDFAPLVERLRRGGSHVTIVGHKADGGLLAQISDEYLAWTSLEGLKGARRAAKPKPPVERPRAPAHTSRPTRSTPRPARPSTGPGSAEVTALQVLLHDAYQVAMTDGEVDADGWVAVDRLGMILQGMADGFDPARFGFGARAPLSRILARVPGFEVEGTRRGRGMQYRVRPTD
ncbi:MAG: NYN domain-containing protein [Thermoplasmatota archaeon]